MKVKEDKPINYHKVQIDNFTDNHHNIVEINLDKNHIIKIEYIDLSDVKTMFSLPVPTLRIYMYDGDETKWFYEGMYDKDTNKLILMEEVRKAIDEGLGDGE